MTIGGGILLLILLFIGWLWQIHLKAKEVALLDCRELCKAHDAQLLDGTVTLKRLTLKRDHGKLHFRREYQFEFTLDGQVRFLGHIVMLSYSVVWHRLDKKALNAEPGQVISLDQYKHHKGRNDPKK